MAGVTSQVPHERMREDPGVALMELLSFADAVALSRPPTPAAALAFPVLARLAQESARAQERGRRASGKRL